jgi:hypothetical protein
MGETAMELPVPLPPIGYHARFAPSNSALDGAMMRGSSSPVPLVEGGWGCAIFVLMFE